MRVTGTVKFFNTAKGYGFIQPENGGKDVFVHATALEQAGIRSLNEGDRVTFVLEDDRRGRGKQAGQIQKAEGPRESLNLRALPAGGRERSRM
jgi:cold shock protein